MMSLKANQYEKARHFLLNNSRKLEAALFAYEFENGYPSEVHRQLAAFQNADGGFGHGLESDLRCAASSVLATTTALQILIGMNEQNTQMIEQAMQYLVSEYKEGRKGWEIIPREAEEAPRAFWWEYSSFENHWGNPNAEIVGYLNKLPNPASKELINQLNTYAAHYLNEVCELQEMHEMLCYVHWSNTLSEDTYAQINSKLNEFIENCIIANPEDRQGYGGYPLMVVKTPQSRYYAKYSNVIPGDLDRMIEAQEEDGSWSPNWAWGRFDDVWETKAKVDWQGVLTLNALRTLKNFGRIEKM